MSGWCDQEERYLELRFNHIIRTIGCLTFSIQMLIYMAIVLYAPALALSQVTGISVWTSVLSIGIVCTFYTSVGGIKAVVWTDVFQIFLMFSSMLLVAFKGAYSIGGFGYVFELASKNQRVEFFNFNPDPTDRHTVWGLIIGCYFTWMSIYAVSQAMVQRYLTLPNLRGARQ
ncbi:putative sodium/solute symporter [Ixodes scapularis]